VGIFEYILVFTSIVIGLAVTHLMQGIAGLVQHPGRAKVWWVHLIWVAYMLLSTVFWWWSEFRLNHVQTWTFELYALVVGYAFIIYLEAALLFPKDLEGFDGYKDFFISRRKWFFGLQIIWSAVDFADTAAKGSAYFASLGLEYPLAEATLTLLAIAGILSRRQSIQAAVAVIYLAYQLSWVIRMYQTVS
jgi:hypothetical protein